VISELEQVENLIYFGLYENETSKRAKIVIPAKSFFEKEDIRLSYGHHEVHKMNKVTESAIGISEYDFCRLLYDRLGFEGLKEESVYLEHWLEQCDRHEERYRSPVYLSQPYGEGFGEEGGEDFLFIDEFYDDFQNVKHLQKYRKLSSKKRPIEEFWLLTPKAKHALNTQFRRSEHVEIHPDLGFDEGQKVQVSSAHGSQAFTVRHNADLRQDCLLITANTIGVNYLTPPILSEEGDNACYQEVKVKIAVHS